MTTCQSHWRYFEILSIVRHSLVCAYENVLEESLQRQKMRQPHFEVKNKKIKTFLNENEAPKWNNLGKQKNVFSNCLSTSCKQTYSQFSKDRIIFHNILFDITFSEKYFIYNLQYVLKDVIIWFFQTSSRQVEFNFSHRFDFLIILDITRLVLRLLRHLLFFYESSDIFFPMCFLLFNLILFFNLSILSGWLS